ncbi:MAG: VPLPA-CTERM sorting domain-containing protein [Gammaproteobacteria bacterium]
MLQARSKHYRALCAAMAMTTVSAVDAATVISELLYDVSGPDTGQVFIELYGTPGTILDGLFLEGVNGTNGSVYKHITLTGVIPADGVFVIGDDDGSGSSLVPNTDQVASIDLQNGPDSVVLRDAGGILDALGYGDFTSAIFAGEGSPAADVVADWSLARRDPRLDANDNGVDFLALDIPTPGLVPASPVPVPAAAWLFLTGIVGLVGVARRKGISGDMDATV